MFDLIRLERKKFKFRFFSLGTLIAQVTTLIMYLFVMFIEDGTEEELMNSVDEMLGAAIIISCVVFVIYGGCVLAKLVISEYEKKTIQLMFMYPINRKKLLMSKLLIVYLFTVINVAISTCLLIAGMGIAEHFIDLVPGNINADYLLNAMPVICVSIFTSGFLAIVPLYFGMRKKSKSHTIIAAVIVASLLGSNGGSMSISIQLVKLMVLGGLAIISFILTVKSQLNKTESLE